MRLTPSHYPYVSSQLYVEAPFIVLIPRFLWPGKPVLDIGYQFSQKYFGIPSFHSHVDPRHQSRRSLHEHFGTAGVVVGMALWGAVAAAISRWFAHRLSSQALLLFVATVACFTLVELDFVSLIAGAFQSILYVVRSPNGLWEHLEGMGRPPG